MTDHDYPMTIGERILRCSRCGADWTVEEERMGGDSTITDGSGECPECGGEGV